MSENRQVLNDIITDRLPGTGDSVRNLRTNKTFVAEIEDVSEIEQDGELGRDPREAIILHVDRAAAAEQNVNDRVQFNHLGQTVKCQILRRENNPVKLQVDFFCMNIVNGKDA